MPPERICKEAARLHLLDEPSQQCDGFGAAGPGKAHCVLDDHELRFHPICASIKSARRLSATTQTGRGRLGMSESMTELHLLDDDLAVLD